MLVELEHLKIKTTLIEEMFASVMDNYIFIMINKAKVEDKIYM